VPNPNPRHNDHDVPMPEDGSESEGSQTATSPLDAEPAQRARRPRQAPQQKRKVVLEEVTTPEDHAEQASPWESASPLDADADAQLATVEVDRIGPGEGQGWVQRSFDYGDGRGAQPVSYGRVGSFPDDAGIYERVQSLVGGGQYRFVRAGKKPVAKVLGGVPLPLPSEQASGPAPSARGGFDREPFFEEGYQPQGHRPDPFEDPSFDPEVGIDPADVVQTSLNGWFRGGPYNRLMYFANGVPSRPPRGSRPPAALLSSPAVGVGDEGFNPAIYDHGGSEAASQSRREWQREQEAARREEEKERRAEEQRRRDEERELRREEEARRRDEEAQRRADEKEERRRDEERRREEEARRREEEKLRREEEREERRRDEERTREERRLQAESAKESARAQAEAVKEAAKLTADSAKETARIQAENNKLLFELMLKKTDGEGSADKIVDRSMRLAEIIQGGKPEGNGASEIADAIKTAVPALAKAGTDVAYAWKGYPVPGQQAAPVLPGAAPAAPQLPNAPPASSGPTPEAREVAANLQLVGYLVQAWKVGMKPLPSLLAHGTLAYGLTNSFSSIAQKVQIATPALVVAEFEKGVAALGSPPMFAAHIPMVREMAASPDGVAWFQAFQQALRRQTQPVAAPAPEQPVAPAQPHHDDPNHRDIMPS
jgi:hypothetical protein